MSTTPSVEVDALIHEIRNALAIAKANLEGVVDGKFAPTQERLLGIIQALNQLDALIEDLRAQSAEVTMPVRPAVINVCELLKREYSAIEPVARAKSINFSTHLCAVPTASCLQFYGDPTRIGQIVKNVLLNAMRYTPSGGTVTVECSRGGDQLEVRIADDGPGIRAEEMSGVFDSGVRGSASAGTGGSGYGLTVVKQLAEAQGGTVSVSSATSRGATFTVRLPGTPMRCRTANYPGEQCRCEQHEL